MPGPLAGIPTVRTIIRAGKEINQYRDGAGKFISEAKYNLLNRRVFRSGFASQATIDRQGTPQERENRFRAKWGAPPKGQIWIQIANKYPERFAAYE